MDRVALPEHVEGGHFRHDPALLRVAEQDGIGIYDIGALEQPPTGLKQVIGAN